MANNDLEIKIGADASQVASELDKIAKSAGKSGETIQEKLSKAFKINSLVDLKAGFDILKGTITGVISQVEGLASKLLETVLAGDKIALVNKQFDILTSQVGISSEALKEGLISAAGGFATTPEILASASRAIVQLGDNASKLPETFELARKVSKVFGGEIVDNFERINNAVAFGSTRLLRQVGIIVDADTAYKNYAKSLGITVDLLTTENKQQALLNVVLETGNKNLSGISLTSETTTTALKKLGVAFTELEETGQSITKNTLGEAFKSVLLSAASGVEHLNLAIKNASGASLTYDEKLKSLEISLKAIEQSSNELLAQGVSGAYDKTTEAIRNQISALKEQRQAQDEASLQTAIKSVSGGNPIDKLTEEQSKAVDEATLARKVKFEAAKNQLTQDSLNFQIDVANKIRDEDLKNSELDAIDLERKQLLEFDHQQKLDKIRSDFGEKNLFSAAQKNSLIEQENSRHQDALTKLESDGAQRRLIAQNNLNRSLTDILKAGIISTTQQMTLALIRGQNAFSALSKGLLNIIGSMATQVGTTLIGIGVGMDSVKASIVGLTGGPAIFAGIALVALGTLLSSLSSGGGASTSVPTGGGVNASSPTFQSDSLNKDIQEKTTNVKIDVAGTVLDPISVGQQIAGILSDTFNATGTKVVTA